MSELLGGACEGKYATEIWGGQVPLVRVRKAGCRPAAAPHARRARRPHACGPAKARRQADPTPGHDEALRRRGESGQMKHDERRADADAADHDDQGQDLARRRAVLVTEDVGQVLGEPRSVRPLR
jgi:hypothetical protein